MKQAIAICVEAVLLAGAIALAVCLYASTADAAGAGAGIGFTGFIEYGSDTCPPCRELWPKLKQLEVEGYAIRWFDAKAEPCVAEQQGVKLWPTTIFYVDGKKAWQAVGVWPIETYRNAAAAAGVMPHKPKLPQQSLPQQPVATVPVDDPPPLPVVPVVPIDPPPATPATAMPQSGCGCGCLDGNCKCCKCDIGGINRTLNLQADRTAALEKIAGDNSKSIGLMQNDLNTIAGRLQEAEANIANHASHHSTGGPAVDVAKKKDDSTAALGWLATLSPWLLGALGISTGGAGTFAALGLRAAYRMLRGRRNAESETLPPPPRGPAPEREPQSAAAESQAQQVQQQQSSAATRTLLQAVPVEKTENHYVRVPASDPEGDAYREAMRNEAAMSPEIAAYLERIEASKDSIVQGRKASSRFGIGWQDNKPLR